MKFLFLLLLFLNIIFCEHFIINAVYLHFDFIKKLQIFLKMNHRCLKEVIAQLHNYLYYNGLVIQMKLSRDITPSQKNLIRKNRNYFDKILRIT